MKKKLDKYLCWDCNNQIKVNQRICKNCWAELVWEIKKEEYEISGKKNKFFLSDEIWVFIILIWPWLALILKNWNNIKSAEILPIILTILYLIWNIIKRPLIIIWWLAIIYWIVKFIKRARNN